MVKRVVKESKRRMDEDFGRNLSNKWRECKKLFWKEVKKVRGGAKSGSKGVKNKDGRMLVEKHEVVDRWRDHFDELLNVLNVVPATLLGGVWEQGEDMLWMRSGNKEIRGL